MDSKGIVKGSIGSLPGGLVQDARSCIALARTDPVRLLKALDSVARQPVRRAEDELERFPAPAKRTGGVAQAI